MESPLEEGDLLRVRLAKAKQKLQDVEFFA